MKMIKNLNVLQPEVNIGVILLTTSVLAACSDGDSQMLSSATAQDLQGAWERSGYGLLLTVNDDELTVFEATRASCYLRDSGLLAEFVGEFPIVEITGEQLRLSESELGQPAIFDRIDALPAVCDNPIGESITKQFDHVWHTFNDYYAFFNERGVDWMSQYDQWRHTLRDQSSELELAEALIGLLTPIDDSHVSLVLNAEDHFNPAKPKGFLQMLIEEFNEQSDIADPETYVGEVLLQWRSDIETNYIGAPFTTLDGELADLIQWGFIGQEVGYLSINQFFTTLNETEAADVVIFDDALDIALTELANSTAMIVDLRLSPGGRDAVSIAIANRFADTQRLAATKVARDYQGPRVTQDFVIKPSERQNYTHPVVLITSGFSASATESFTLLMRSLPHVTHIGEPTNGALSDVLEKELPNGWDFTLSNEVYLDANGQSFEVVGIPPTISVPVLSKEARDRGEDSALNAAFDVLALPNPALQSRSESEADRFRKFSQTVPQ